MSGCELDEPDDAEYCEAVMIAQDGKEEAELTIFYTPSEGLARLCFTRVICKISI